MCAFSWRIVEQSFLLLNVWKNGLTVPAVLASFSATPCNPLKKVPLRITIRNYGTFFPAHAICALLGLPDKMLSIWFVPTWIRFLKARILEKRILTVSLSLLPTFSRLFSILVSLSSRPKGLYLSPICWSLLLPDSSFSPFNSHILDWNLVLLLFLSISFPAYLLYPFMSFSSFFLRFFLVCSCYFQFFFALSPVYSSFL